MSTPPEGHPGAPPTAVQGLFPDVCGLGVAVVCALGAGVLIRTGWGTQGQSTTWMMAALLTGMWVLPATPLVFPVLLAVLVLCLFDVVAPTQLLAGAAGDALLWLLGAFALSVAASDSGLLGTLVARATRSLRTATRARPGLPAVLWLGAAFALLPSPVQAQRWALAFCAVPTLLPAARCDIARAARLWSRLAWLPAHPVSLIALGLLPSGGLDRFVPMHWLLHTWPLWVLALAHGMLVQWGASPVTAPEMPRVALLPVAHEDAPAQRSVLGVVAASVLAIGLQPFHGLAPGMVAVFALVLLFALQVLPPGRFHHDVDWALFLCVALLPGLITVLAVPLPMSSLAWPLTALALPFLLLLRTVLPSVGAASVALLLALSWAHRTGHDLLDIALPVLVAAHIADFMLSRRGTEDAAVGMRAVAGALLRPANWLWAGAFYLWLAWVGL